MITLEKLATMTASVGSIATTRRMPSGTRQNYIVSGGTLSGRLSGKVLPGGGDFLFVDPDGLGLVDGRLTWELDDGAIIYVVYPGRVVMTDAVAQAFKTGGETQFGDTYFVTQMRFETGYADYLWLNSTVAIAEGRVAEGRCIQYNIYNCVLAPARIDAEGA